ncbi:hypothetical protein RND81_02G028500 [Saponaria officinalis]|uniref:Galectin n=1 Tax=Saponaria officinalis TaxID=3572 RepID=A0AAW1MQR5_SAPOF
METFVGIMRAKSVRILALLLLLYMIFIVFEIPFVFQNVSNNVGFSRSNQLENDGELQKKNALIRPLNDPLRVPTFSSIWSKPRKRIKEHNFTFSGLVFDWKVLNKGEKDGFSGIHKSAMMAFKLGEKLWEELKLGKVKINVNNENVIELSCPNSISMSGIQFIEKGEVMELPCGLTLGSHITLVAKPRMAHVRAEFDPNTLMLKNVDESVMVSQFMVELIGLKTVDGEYPPRILHFNARLKGDWSGNPAIEQNTCYRQQWGTPVRCQGSKSKPQEETVDGLVKCEKWIEKDASHAEESRLKWWLSRLLRRPKKLMMGWPFPFTEDKLFVLTLSAGLEGYHVNVDGRAFHLKMQLA